MVVVEEEEFVRILMDAAEGKTPRERERERGGTGGSGRQGQRERRRPMRRARSLSHGTSVYCVYHFVHTVATHTMSHHHTYYVTSSYMSITLCTQ